MLAETVKIPGTLYREFQVKKNSVDKENRTVPMSFSSELPVRRMTDDGTVYNEILDHNPKSVLLDRLTSGAAPLLMHHDPKDQVGVIKSAQIGDNKRGSAVVQFSRSARGEEVMNDVEDGIRGSTSVGYQVHSMDQDEDEPEDGDGVPNYRCAWEPLEVSLESIPADHTVGAGRSQTITPISVPITRKAPKIMITRTRNLAPDATAGGGSVITAEELQTRVAEATKADKLRVATILDLAGQYEARCPGLTVESRSFISDGKSEDEFVRHILEKRTNLKPIGAAAATDTTIGMTPSEVQQYSIIRAINMLSSANGHGKLEGLEKEAHEAAVKRSGRDLQGPKSFMIPEDVIRAKFRGEGFKPGRMSRDMQAGVAALGGSLVETEVLGSSLIELLRNKMQVVNAGAQTMGGLKGNVAIPRQTAASTAYWLGEIQAVLESDQALQQLLLSPHRLVANTAYSNLLLAQATLDAEAFVRMDLMKQLALAKDLAAISGTGGAQPLGIINTTGVGTTAFTPGTPTWGQIVGMESIVAAANADFGALAYMVSAKGRGVLKQTQKVSGTGFPIFMWEAPIDATKAKEGEGSVNGYRSLATNQLNTAFNGDKGIFGNWEDVLIADWEGWEVLVDPYTLSKNGEVQVTIFNFTDIGIKHPGSFCFSTNSLI